MISSHFTLFNKKTQKELTRAPKLSLTQTDYEDNKMKKDYLATLHMYSNNYLLSNQHPIISKMLIIPKKSNIFGVFTKKT